MILFVSCEDTFEAYGSGRVESESETQTDTTEDTETDTTIIVPPPVDPYDVTNFTCLKTFEGHSSYVSSVAYSPDGTKIISGSDDKTIKIWDANTGQCLKSLEGHSDYVNSVAFSPDGTKIISGSTDTTVKIWGEE